VKAGEIQQLLPGSNPWWSDDQWATKDLHLKTAGAAPFHYEPTVLADAVAPNLYTLRGPRRVGKTTLLKQFVRRAITFGIAPRQICYFGVDLLNRHQLLQLVGKMHRMFPDLADRPVYFLLDEISMVKEWWIAIKWLRDQDRRAQEDCFILTGSSARDIREGLPFLAGREGERAGYDRTLLPMAFPEYARALQITVPGDGSLSLADFFTPGGEAALLTLQLHTDELVAAFDRYLVSGGFPRALVDHLATGSVSAKFLQDLWKVVLGDLQTLKLTQTKVAIELTRTVVAGMASPTNFQTLATNSNTNGATAKGYVEALNDAYLLLTIYQRASHGGSKLQAGPKIYVADPLLAQLPAAVLGTKAVPDITNLAEAAVAIAIFRAHESDLQTSFGSGSTVYYYVTQRGNEIDFIVPTDDTLTNSHPVEVKYVDDVSGQDTLPITNAFHRGLLLTHGVLNLAGEIKHVPAAFFAYLLHQR